jgi:hypothetical protein
MNEPMNEIICYDDLISYIKLQLGAPIIRVNLTDNQFLTAIDNTLRYYRMYHYNGSERSIVSYQISQTDIDNKYLTLDKTINGIREVSISANGSMLGWHGITAVSFWDSFMTAAGGDSRYSVMSYMSLEQQLGDLRSVFNNKVVWNFSRVKYKLNIVTDWSKMVVGDYVIIECTKEVDPEEDPEVFNDTWFREMAVQQSKLIWGRVLGKFGNVSLPGGVVIDGAGMQGEAQAKIDELRAEIESKWQMPAMMILG